MLGEKKMPSGTFLNSLMLLTNSPTIHIKFSTLFVLYFHPGILVCMFSNENMFSTAPKLLCIFSFIYFFIENIQFENVPIHALLQQKIKKANSFDNIRTLRTLREIKSYLCTMEL